MDERKITMWAIRYNGQLCEAISFEVFGQHLNDAMKAAQICQRCSDNIEHIAQYDIEDVSTPDRLHHIARSLKLLAAVRQDFDAVLSSARLHVPSTTGIDILSATALALAETLRNPAISGDT